MKELFLKIQPLIHNNITNLFRFVWWQYYSIPNWIESFVSFFFFWKIRLTIQFHKINKRTFIDLRIDRKERTIFKNPTVNSWKENCSTIRIHSVSLGNNITVSLNGSSHLFRFSFSKLIKEEHVQSGILANGSSLWKRVAFKRDRSLPPNGRMIHDRIDPLAWNVEEIKNQQ